MRNHNERRRHENQKRQPASVFRSKKVKQADNQDRCGCEFFRMRHTEVSKCGKRADRRRDQIIGNQQKRAHNRNHFRAMPDGCINAAAVRVEAADDHVVEPDEGGEHAHRSDQPERGVAGNRKGEADHVGFAGAPVAVQNRRRARNIDIARSLNVCWYQLIRLKRDRLARRGASLPGVGFHDIPCPLMVLTRLAVGMEPLIGLAFVAAGFSSLPIILAVCALTGLVGVNYIVICRHFPDGGGVYSAAREQSRLLAVVGALLLVANLTVTAALSGWAALTYVTSGAEHITWIKFLHDHIALATTAVLLFIGAIHYFGP